MAKWSYMCFVYYLADLAYRTSLVLENGDRRPVEEVRISVLVKACHRIPMAAKRDCFVSGGKDD